MTARPMARSFSTRIGVCAALAWLAALAPVAMAQTTNTAPPLITPSPFPLAPPASTPSVTSPAPASPTPSVVNPSPKYPDAPAPSVPPVSTSPDTAPAPTAANTTASSPPVAASNDPLLQPWVQYTRPPPGQPLPASEEQLEQVLSIAATSSPMMHQQKYAVEMVDASRYRSWVQSLPLLSATYNLGMFYQANYSLNTSNQVQPGGAYTLQADYPLIDWGALTATKSLAFLKEQLAQNEAVITYGNLCVQIREKYHALIVQKAFVSVLAEQLQSASRNVDKARLLFKQGRVTATSVTQSETAFSKLALDKNDADGMFTSQLRDFKRTSGASTFTDSDVPDRIYLPITENTNLQPQFDGFLPDDANHSLLAREAALTEDSYNQQITINDAKTLPTLDLTAGISQAPYATSSNNLQFSTILFFGLSGTWNIFDRGETRAQSLSLMAERRLNLAKLADIRDETMDDAANRKSQIDLGLRSLNILKDQLAQSQKSYQRVKTLESTGHTTPADIDAARDAILELRYEILKREAEVADGYYGFISDLFRDPALVNAPSFTQPRGP